MFVLGVLLGVEFFSYCASTASIEFAIDFCF
jgi:hypothetical protein